MAGSNKITARLMLVVLGLLGFGLLMVYDSSSSVADRQFADKWYFFKDQLRWIFLGIWAMIVGSVIPYKVWSRFALVILVVAFILLMGVFIPGIGIKAYGASRWLNLHLFTLQPSEFAKLGLVIYLAAWFGNREKGRLMAFVLLMGVLAALIILQPDMGTAMVLAITGVGMYFLMGAPLWHFLAILPAGVVAAIAMILVAPYRFKRLSAFLELGTDPAGGSYHVRHALIALGSGGLFGLGLGNSRQKYSYLPESFTDSIFGIIGEEVGFVGCLILILTFIYLLFLGFKISWMTKDRFGSLLAGGISIWLAVQTLINLGAMMATIPLTGVPLPFISYGGSALVTELFAVGILLNISKSI